MLYTNQKEYYDNNNIQVESKKKCMEYIKKIRFLVGTYVQLASPDYYINEITNDMNLEEGIIDIKKRFTYEKNTRSKVLTVYAIENEAQDVDERLCEIKSLRYT